MATAQTAHSTRSKQPTLHRFFAPRLDQSPLKAAKTAARNGVLTGPGPSRLSSKENVDSDDEILLSPQAKPRKRSSSPFERDDDANEASDRTGHQPKRAKLDNAAGHDPADVFPQTKQPRHPFDFDFDSSCSPTPPKALPQSPRKTPDTSRSRSQSVPPTSPVRYVNLRASPLRKPSSSPERRTLRFTSMPPDLDAASEETAMDVDASHPSLPPSSDISDSSDTAAPAASSQSSENAGIVPKTPAHLRPSLSSLPSPLTPISATPAPSRPQRVLAAAEFDSSFDREDEGESLAVTPRALPAVRIIEDETPKAHESAPFVFGTKRPVTPERPPSRSNPVNAIGREDAQLTFQPKPDPEPKPEPESRPASIVSHRSSSSLSVSRIPKPSMSTHPHQHRRTASESSLSSAPSSDVDTDTPSRSVPPPRPSTSIQANQSAVPRRTVSGRARGRARKIAGVGRGRPIAAGGARVTRSASLRRQREEDKAKDREPVASSSTAATTTSAQPPSPKKARLSNFAAPTSSSLGRAAERAALASPTKKPVSLPKPTTSKPASPVKPASSTGFLSSSHSTHFRPPSYSSTLSNLSNAMAKLKRPGTSMGFTREDSASGTSGDKGKAKDDIAVNNGASAAHGAQPLKRANTLAALGSGKPTGPVAGSSRPSAAYAPPVARLAPKRISLASGIVVGKSSGGTNRLFAPRQRMLASKKSSLPVVEGSPVKEGAAMTEEEEEEPGVEADLKGKGKERVPNQEQRPEEQGENGEPTKPKITPMDIRALLDPGEEALFDFSMPDAPPKPRRMDVWRNASRRASMASQMLNETLEGLPQTPPRPARGKPLEVRSGSPSERSKSLRSAGERGEKGKGAHVSAGSGSRQANGSGSGPKKTSSLKVLKQCTVFVDVRTDDGDDAGGLFVDMLKGLGAKVLGRVGQTCTHIVFKNGLMSTLTRYRLSPEPKPKVVGIAWVVECVEQRAHVDEARFSVDLEGMNVAGVNRRRRSMLPKHVTSGPHTLDMGPPPVPRANGNGPMHAGDTSFDSMDGDSSSNTSMQVVEEEDLPPLERARRRRNMLPGGQRVLKFR